jgi:uncharacterized protein YigA (DUF484 family)
MPDIPDPTSGNRVFISCVSDEFEKPDAPFPGLRGALRHYLTCAHCEVKVQEDLQQDGAVDTVEKLDGCIRRCAAVLHLVGEMEGAHANSKAVRDYLATEPDFLKNHPELREALGDFSGITYTQWEAFIALHHDVPLSVYATPQGETAQATHLSHLRLGRKFPGEKRITDPADLLGQLIGDIHSIIASVPKFERKLASSKILRHVAENFIGREGELALLDTAWADGTNVLSLIAWGGVGKTALLVEWVRTRFIEKQWLAADGQPALMAYFDWSFYDQGTRSIEGQTVRTGSVGDFFEQALTFFDDANPSAPGKGERLARKVREQRTLLILDGLEPLQQPVGHPQAGRLLDPDLRDLLCGLAQANPGLCVISSRQALTDLDGLQGHAARRENLEDLPKAVAVRLLRQMQIIGTDPEMEAACEKFGCHALSLTLLGRFLFDAHGGDIARADRVNLHRADDLTREDRKRTAWRVLEAYEEWLSKAKAGGHPNTLAVLRLTGLFDRAATADCLAVLRGEPVIPGLTEAVCGMGGDEWNILLNRLDRAHLIKVSDDPNPQSAIGNPQSLDAHPLVREYFAEQLKREQPSAFRAAHSRLFDHLCANTPHRPDTLAGLQPLYQAVAHGCLAGRQQEACDKVYLDRILRGTDHDGFYSSRKLGAIGADLGAVAAFFKEPWSRLSPNLSAPDQAWLLNAAAFRLRALGRLTEAVEPMRVSFKQFDDAKDWKRAAGVGCNLSELEVTLGRLGEAVADGRRAIGFADRSGDAFWKMGTRSAAADALHQAEERAEAGALFAEAERLQVERQPAFPLLYSLQGFQYADLLLAPAERAAWKAVPSFISSNLSQPEARELCSKAASDGLKPGTTLPPLAACAEAERQTAANQERRTGLPTYSLLDIALDHLTLARARLYRALLTSDEAALRNLESEIRTALAKLRQANSLHELPKALLTAALHAGVSGQAAEAARFLDEAQLIAQRGPMPLYLADVHLHRARLFGKRSPESGDRKGPDSDPNADLARARALIEQHGYWRRKEELEDAES